MLDGLLDLLKLWISWAFCWVVDSLLSMAFAVFKGLFLLIPDYNVPSVLQGTISSTIQFDMAMAAWFLPFGLMVWTMGLYYAMELVFFSIVPIYRFLVDLF